MSHGYGSDNQQYGTGVPEVPGRSGQLDRVLSDLMGQAPEVEAAAVVSFDGLPMASALPAGMDEDRVAAMSAALLSLGERAAQGLGRGDLNQVYVEGQSGTVFLVSADDEAVLVAVGAQGAKVGLVMFEVRQAAERVAAVLREVPEPFARIEPAATPVPDFPAQPEPQPAPVPAPVPVAEVPPMPEPAPQPTPQPTPQPVPVAEVQPMPERVAAMPPMNELPPTPAPIEALPPVPVPVAEPAVDHDDVGQGMPAVPAAQARGNGANGTSGAWPVYPSANGDSSSWS